MNEIKQHIEDITDYLLTLTNEERLAWFKKNMFLKPLNFIKEIDNTTYAARTYFNNNANENITEKENPTNENKKKQQNTFTRKETTEMALYGLGMLTTLVILYVTYVVMKKKKEKKEKCKKKDTQTKKSNEQKKDSKELKNQIYQEEEETKN